MRKRFLNQLEPSPKVHQCWKSSPTGAKRESLSWNRVQCAITGAALAASKSSDSPKPLLSQARTECPGEDSIHQERSLGRSYVCIDGAEGHAHRSRLCQSGLGRSLMKWGFSPGHSCHRGIAKAASATTSTSWSSSLSLQGAKGCVIRLVKIDEIMGYSWEAVGRVRLLGGAFIGLSALKGSAFADGSISHSR